MADNLEFFIYLKAKKWWASLARVNNYHQTIVGWFGGYV